MKVLLAYPPFLLDRVHEENIEALPMGVNYLAATLIRDGHEVRIADWHGLGRDPRAVAREILSFGPDLLGMSIFHANRWGGIDAARLAKQVMPGLPTVFGGIGATFLSKLLLTRFPDAVDYVIRGEGELPLSALARALETGGSMHEVPGLSWLDNGTYTESDCPEPIPDLDALPDPAEHFTFCHVALTRGCPGSCAFCGSPEFWGRRVRFHSPEYFVRQLERLHAKGVDFLYVSDDTFTLKKDVVLKVCELIRARLPKISWAAISRVDRVDADILKAMRLAGCIQISYGVESGSDRIRMRLGKNTKREDIVRAFRLTTAHSILARAYIIYGCPGEDESDIRATMDLLAEIKPLITLFHILQVFPGTRLCRELTEQGRISEELWMERIEDIMHFQADPEADPEAVMERGRELKHFFHDALPEFAASLELANDPDLHPAHAEFLSRLGMTFHHGDYAGLFSVREAEDIARSLYQRALDYGPDARAVLGLGRIASSELDWDEAVRILAPGVETWPDNPDLAMHLAAALANLGRNGEARRTLEPFAEFGPARDFLAKLRQNDAMRIWDIDPGYLDRQRLLGEHRELHGLFNVLTQGKRGYSRHPETLRWVGCVPALAFRHELLMEEMTLRGYNHQSPLSLDGDMPYPDWPATFIDPPAGQYDLLRQKFGSDSRGRIALPRNGQELWAQHKYSVMARDPELYRKLGPEVADRTVSFADLAGLLTDTLRCPPAPGRLANALMHMWGYVNHAPATNGAATDPAESDSVELLARIRENVRDLESGYLEQSTALGELGAWARLRVRDGQSGSRT